MFRHWIIRDANLALAIPVYGAAAVVFPLHLGWTGASPGALAIYLLAATVLFSLRNALAEPSFYPTRASVIAQALLILPALAVPAALAFTVGAVAGPIDETFDEEYCATRGATESDTPGSEADDTFDVTPDCSPERSSGARLR